MNKSIYVFFLLRTPMCYQYDVCLYLCSQVCSSIQNFGWVQNWFFILVSFFIEHFHIWRRPRKRVQFGFARFQTPITITTANTQDRAFNLIFYFHHHHRQARVEINKINYLVYELRGRHTTRSRSNAVREMRTLLLLLLLLLSDVTLLIQ